MTSTVPWRVLIADDNAKDRKMVRRRLPPGYVGCEAATESEADEILLSEDIHIAFVDVFFRDDDQNANGIALGERLSARIPVIYISDKSDRTQEALRNARIPGLDFLDKNRDFDDPAIFERRVREACARYYSPIEIAFPGHETSWGNIAGKLESDPERRAGAELELQSLIRRAMHGWDESGAPDIEATRVELRQIPGSGDNSVVLRMRPFAATSEQQADVVVKFSRNRDNAARTDRVDRDEHTQYDRYKNVIGGYGLRERRHARRCRFQAQVFAVPYFRLEQTQTYADYFDSEADTDTGLRRLDSITTYLFDLALGPLNGRLMSDGREIALRDYYAVRINASKRLASIRDDLTRWRRPSSLHVTDTHIVIPSESGARTLANPAGPVLETGAYACAGERASIQLRHGDFHSGNVLVDPDRWCCWYLDYESMDANHFYLVDHVELESDILFSLMRVEDNYEFVARLIDAITGPKLAECEDVADLCGSDRHVAPARKALTAIRAIRSCARRALAPGSVRPYYHALMFEALRIAGKPTLDPSQRWRALVAAAVIFDKLENVYAHG